MIILGIESSCDETAASIVKDGKIILSNIISSQINIHSKFQGVVPEIASRMHLEKINSVIDRAFATAELKYTDIDAVAVVNKPGLIGSLLIGVATAQVFAFQFDVPLITVNHLEAHLYSAHLEHKIPFPNIALVVSGGHTLLYYSKSFSNHEIIGSTVDDAIGECYDKIAKYFNLGYPGGPIIDKLAKEGNPDTYNFPRTKFKKTYKFYYFSYSGLKSAVIHQREQFRIKSIINYENNLQNILASFQKIAIQNLIKASQKACIDYKINTIIISGGVACNSYLRTKFKSLKNIKSYFPSNILCTDNAAMTAGLAFYLKDQKYNKNKSLKVEPKVIKNNILYNFSKKNN